MNGRFLLNDCGNFTSTNCAMGYIIYLFNDFSSFFTPTYMYLTLIELIIIFFNQVSIKLSKYMYICIAKY